METLKRKGGVMMAQVSRDTTIDVYKRQDMNCSMDS